jgi:hypothetical protein
LPTKREMAIKCFLFNPRPASTSDIW